MAEHGRSAPCCWGCGSDACAGRIRTVRERRALSLRRIWSYSQPATRLCSAEAQGSRGGMSRNRFRSFGSVRLGGDGSFQTDRPGTAPVLYRRANGWGDKSCLCCDVCRYWLASNFADAFLFSLSFDGELHGLHPPLCFAAAAVVCASSRVMRRVLLWPVSISSCVVRPLSVVCISLSCCAVVISMLGLRTALCCAADFVCCCLCF